MAAPVGFQCPDCVAGAAASRPRVTTVAGGTPITKPLVTYSLIGVNVVDLPAAVHHRHQRRRRRLGDVAGRDRRRRRVVAPGDRGVPARLVPAHRLQHVRAVRARPDARADPRPWPLPDAVRARGARRRCGVVRLLRHPHGLRGCERRDLRPDGRARRRRTPAALRHHPGARAPRHQRRHRVLRPRRRLASAPGRPRHRSGRGGDHGVPGATAPNGGPGERPAGRGVRAGRAGGVADHPDQRAAGAAGTDHASDRRQWAHDQRRCHRLRSPHARRHRQAREGRAERGPSDRPVRARSSRR